MRDRKRWGVVGGLALIVAVALAIVGVTTASGGKSAKKPIVIGFAADLSGQMAPFDNPALTAAKLEVAKINGARPWRAFPKTTPPATRAGWRRCAPRM